MAEGVEGGKVGFEFISGGGSGVNGSVEAGTLIERVAGRRSGALGEWMESNFGGIDVWPQGL